jgi:hypothetical protein
MREIRSYGSVRGVAGDCYPYRDSLGSWSNVYLNTDIRFRGHVREQFCPRGTLKPEPSGDIFHLSLGQ